MPKFNNLGQLSTYIREQVQDVLNNEVKDKVAEVMKKQINAQVYSSYNPSSYKRRHELDKDSNIVGTMINPTTLEVKDVAKLSPPYVKRHSQTNELALTEIVATQGAYDLWNGKKSGSFLKPRDFIQSSKQELSNGEIERALKDGLRKRGVITSVKAKII